MVNQRVNNLGAPQPATKKNEGVRLEKDYGTWTCSIRHELRNVAVTTNLLSQSRPVLMAT